MKMSLGFWGELKRAVAFILVLSLVMTSLQLLNGWPFNFKNISTWVISYFFYGLPFYFANAYLNEGLNKLYSWLTNPKKRALIGIPAVMIMNTGLMILLIYAYSLLILDIDEPKLFDKRNTNSIIVSLIICLVATLYFHAVGFFKGYISQLNISKQLKEEKVIAELNALKSQVNPHFLFNSFNVLSGLIDEDPDKAQKFLSGLSKIYRYILENRNEDLSTVREELSFAQQYFKLQQTRFENSIQMDIEVPEKVMDKKIPALSLQLLLENAIKHNGFNTEKPLKITIHHKVNSLIITNNKQVRSNLYEGNGVGLSNIKQRYELHKVEGFAIDDKDELFTVTLPMI